MEFAPKSISLLEPSILSFSPWVRERTRLVYIDRYRVIYYVYVGQYPAEFRNTLMILNVYSQNNILKYRNNTGTMAFKIEQV